MEIYPTAYCMHLSAEEFDLIKSTIALRLDYIENVKDPEERKEVDKETSCVLLEQIHMAMCLCLNE